MGAKFYFTSRIDGFVRLFLGVPLMVAIMFSVGGLINEIIKVSKIALDKNVIDWVVALGGIIIGGYIYTKYVVNVLHVLASFLHLRLALRVNVTWKEAKSLAALFVLNEEGTWYLLDEVKKLPPEARKAYLFEVAKKVGRLDWV